MSDLLDYAEQAGLENLRFRLNNVETLARESNTLLTMLLAGIGGSLAFVIQAFKSPESSAVTFGIVALTAWLMVISILLVMKCIMTKALEVPTNEPLNLYVKEHESTEVREGELQNIQYRIDQTQQRNQRVAYWLDRCRLMAISSPVAFGVGLAVSYGL